MPPHLALQCSSSTPVSDHHADVAWHLLTVLLRLRRPAHPSELSSGSTNPFGPLSPNLIRFLSRIPGSPLHLRQDGLITVSAGATAAFLAFAYSDFPRISFEIPLRTKIWDSSDLSFRRSMGRKRKGGELFPIAKRRLTVLESEDRAKEDTTVSGSGVADEGPIFNIGTTHATESKLLIDQNHGQDELFIPNEDHATISLPDLGASPPSDSGNGINYDKGEGAVELRSSQPEGCSLVPRFDEVRSLPEQLEHDSHDVLMNRKAADFAELVAKEPWTFTTETVLGVSAAKPDEHLLSVWQKNGMAVQQNLNGFSSEAQGGRNWGNGEKGKFADDDKGSRTHDLENVSAVCAADASLGANVACGGGLLFNDEKGCRTRNLENGDAVCADGTLLVANVASGGELFFDDEKGSRIHNLEDEDVVCAGGTLLDGNIDVPWASIRSLDNTLVEIQVDHGFAKREATSGSLALKKSSIKDDILVSATKKEGCTGSFGCNEDVDNGAQVEIRKKYVRRKLKVQNHGTEENVAESASALAKDQVGANKFPQFDAFIVEDEEGSGGYGTVYRAQRKDDGKTFAVKCPHSNAHSYHINNELRMLERFGGRSFIIRLEGSFEREKSECFVLEHVEHDRPEVLKREIEVSELRWYCYCLFKALSSLHKQGVAHRDVKPGNFLFSRKVGKGYLIDFNLASDLHHKHRLNHRYEPGSSFGPVESSLRKVAPLTSSKKALNSQYPEAGRRDRSKELKRLSLSQSHKKGTEKGRLDGVSDFNSRHKNINQAADGSGLTSVKDATSNRTPSAERMREPLPCRGRKELLSLVQEAMHSPRQKSPPPISQRKRIPAPLGKAEKLLALLTPMPLQLNGGPLSTGHLKNKGPKEKPDGPCVGTKGFRAPEVLLRSRHQGCKVDVWSAGVTILYMIIGRMPFSGDPEQNIKEIAKMKGSEDLWEIAKIHDRESSFPTELLDIRYLQSLKLREWCKKNTKKPEFLDGIPDALFDLVERCLAVNPRLRISSEEVLIHDFLSPCREELRKQRIIRVSRESQMELHAKL